MQTETALQRTELIKTEEVTSILSTAPDILSKNQDLLEKATAKAQLLLNTAASGMSDELDAELNDWQVKSKSALKILNDRRSPITQMLTLVQKAFTGMEAQIDPAKPDSYYAKIQKLRDGHAAEKIRIQRQKEAEIQKQQNIKNERNDLFSKVELSIRTAFQDNLLRSKSRINTFFESITLENFEEAKGKLEAINVAFTAAKLEEFKTSVQGVYLSAEEVAEIDKKVKESIFDELAADFRENMEVAKQEVLDKLPSKKIELEAMAKANAAELEKLEADRLRRIKEDEDKLKAEAAEANAKAEQAVNTQKETESVQNLFEAQAALAGVQAGTNAKEGYNIEVKNYAGWMMLSAFWFEHEGKTLAADKFDKKTLGQMKAFAEKTALKDDKKKLDSPHLAYHEVFKAVTTKA